MITEKMIMIMKMMMVISEMKKRTIVMGCMYVDELIFVDMDQALEIKSQVS